MPVNCAEMSKVTSGGGNWILRDLGPPEAKAFDRKYSPCICLWNTKMKNWFRHHLENFISFPLTYRFAGIRRVLTELEADNWKHRSNYTVTLAKRWGKDRFKSLKVHYSYLRTIIHTWQSGPFLVLWFMPHNIYFCQFRRLQLSEISFCH